jgi:Na+-driven multidrug efflux pump
MKTTTNGTTATSLSKKKVVMTILGANLAMICKQGSLLLAWAYATSRATRIGSAHVAAHQVGLSCWLVFALIQDGAGVAAQVLLTKVIKNGSSSSTYKKVRSLVLYMLRFSFLQGLATTGALLLASPYLPKLFVPCDAVVQGHLKSLLPHLAWQQILVSLTLVIESLAIGGSQFRLLAIGTTFSTVFAIAQLRQATTVVDIWSRGIVSLFAGRLVTALIGVACVLRRCRKERDEETMTTVTPKQLDIEVYPKHFPG